MSNIYVGMDVHQASITLAVLPLLEEAIAERARQLGDANAMRLFFDEVTTGWIRELKPGVEPLPFR